MSKHCNAMGEDRGPSDPPSRTNVRDVLVHLSSDVLSLSRPERECDGRAFGYGCL